MIKNIKRNLIFSLAISCSFASVAFSESHDYSATTLRNPHYFETLTCDDAVPKADDGFMLYLTQSSGHSTKYTLNIERSLLTGEQHETHIVFQEPSGDVEKNDVYKSSDKSVVLTVFLESSPRQDNKLYGRIQFQNHSVTAETRELLCRYIN